MGLETVGVWQPEKITSDMENIMNLTTAKAFWEVRKSREKRDKNLR